LGRLLVVDLGLGAYVTGYWIAVQRGLSFGPVMIRIVCVSTTFRVIQLSEATLVSWSRTANWLRRRG
jgi:hypothetical protein